MPLKSSRRLRIATLLALLAASLDSNARQSVYPVAPRVRDRDVLPAGWAGDWDGAHFIQGDPDTPPDLLPEPALDKADAMIIAHLQPSALAKRDATPYDGSPGSLCDPEGWFPFINYNYGFAMLASQGKITLVPVEPDTEGVRRIYFKPNHPEHATPTWNGDSIAHWDGDTLVIDTVGFNDLSWLGDDREPHSTALHMIERMRMIRGGKFLQVETEISDPRVLTSPYKLTRYFYHFNHTHVGGGPSRISAELVCNEDPSPFMQEAKQPNAPKP